MKNLVRKLKARRALMLADWKKFNARKEHTSEQQDDGMNLLGHMEEMDFILLLMNEALAKTKKK